MSSNGSRETSVPKKRKLSHKKAKRGKQVKRKFVFNSAMVAAPGDYPSVHCAFFFSFSLICICSTGNEGFRSMQISATLLKARG